MFFGRNNVISLRREMMLFLLKRGLFFQVGPPSLLLFLIWIFIFIFYFDFLSQFRFFLWISLNFILSCTFSVFSFLCFFQFSLGFLLYYFFSNGTFVLIVSFIFVHNCIILIFFNFFLLACFHKNKNIQTL